MPIIPSSVPGGEAYLSPPKIAKSFGQWFSGLTRKLLYSEKLTWFLNFLGLSLDLYGVYTAKNPNEKIDYAFGTTLDISIIEHDARSYSTRKKLEKLPCLGEMPERPAPLPTPSVNNEIPDSVLVKR